MKRIVIYLLFATRIYAASDLENHITQVINEQEDGKIYVENTIIPNLTKAQLKECELQQLDIPKLKYSLDTVKVKLTCRDGRYFQFRVKLTGYAKTLISQRKIKRGTPLKSSYFHQKKQALKDLRSGFTSEKLLPYYYTAKRNMDVGETLYSKNLSVTFDVETGRMVKVLIEVNGIYVQTEGIPKENGIKGQYIKVKNRASGKEFFAQIIDRNTVRAQQ